MYKLDPICYQKPPPKFKILAFLLVQKVKTDRKPHIIHYIINTLVAELKILKFKIGRQLNYTILLFE